MAKLWRKGLEVNNKRIEVKCDSLGEFLPVIDCYSTGSYFSSTLTLSSACVSGVIQEGISAEGLLLAIPSPSRWLANLKAGVLAGWLAGWLADERARRGKVTHG